MAAAASLCRCCTRPVQALNAATNARDRSRSKHGFSSCWADARFCAQAFQCQKAAARTLPVARAMAGASVALA